MAGKRKVEMKRDEHEHEHEHEWDRTDTQELHYRVTLDFRMSVRPITPEVCEETVSYNAQDKFAGTAYFVENIARQKRLYQRLRRSGPLLEQYLLSKLTEEVGAAVHEGLSDAFEVRSQDEILTQLYRGMAAEDAALFEEGRRMDALDENTELIIMAIKVEWVGAEVAEIKKRLVGDVKRVEIIEETKMRLMTKLGSLW